MHRIQNAYVQNGFHPLPSKTAPHHVRETFALARGVVPAQSAISSLLVSGRGYRAFDGSLSDFVRYIQRGPTIVFFYKPACGPCAVIRKKIISSVGEGFHFLQEKGKFNAAMLASNKEGTAQHTQELVDGACGSSPSDNLSYSNQTYNNTTTSSHGANLTNSNEAQNSDPSQEVDVDSPAAAAAEVTANVIHDEELRELPEDVRELLQTMSPEDQQVCVGLNETLQLKLANSKDRLRFITINTDENKRLTALHDVRSLPTFVGYNKGTVIGRVEEADQDRILQLIVKILDVDEGAANKELFSEEE